ncbi:hypothetical protein RIB2604_01701180 [Aspergillus luchuensis]|uniref:Uncharacterized protein n=1 Tax=Aspergillus kawachii TaxID=1069201 RepID=A0A146FBC4_ASPKA|nr:hypothetical protein RIB2604_01701180 [Aspergillus luchuensis]
MTDRGLADDVASSTSGNGSGALELCQRTSNAGASQN